MCSPYTAWPDNYHEWAVARCAAGDDTPLEELAARFYDARAGEHAFELQGALDAVADRLLAEKTPDRELKRLDAVLARLPRSSALARYRLWREYVALGRRARDLALTGRDASAAQAEHAVVQFLRSHAGELQDYYQLSAILCIAARNEELAHRRVAARQGAESRGRWEKA
jgi:hypothetical protein